MKFNLCGVEIDLGYLDLATFGIFGLGIIINLIASNPSAAILGIAVIVMSILYYTKGILVGEEQEREKTSKQLIPMLEELHEKLAEKIESIQMIEEIYEQAKEKRVKVDGKKRI